MSEDVTPARDDIQLSTVGLTAAGGDTVNSAGQLLRNSGMTLGSPIPAGIRWEACSPLSWDPLFTFPSFLSLKSTLDGVMG